MTQTKTSPNTPKLRFKDFSGEWEEKKLGEVSKIYDGTHSTPKYKKTGIPFYSVEHLTANQFLKTKYISEEVFEKENKRVKLEKNDILMTRIGDIGTSKLLNWNVKASFYVSLSLIKQSEQFHSGFLNQYIGSNFFQNELWKRTIHVAFPKKINLGEIGNCIINLPPLPEQQKIASFLSSVDEKIESLKNKKELLEEYKKGVMQKIFSREIRFEGDFGEWEEKKLGDLIDYKNGGSFEKNVVEKGEYNLITLNSIDINGKIKSFHKKVNITDNSLIKGDLIMVLSDVAHGNFLGLTDIIPGNNFVLNQRMGALKPKIKLNRFFLKTLINYNQKYFKLHGQGSSQQNLSKGDILKFKFGFPSLPEQEKIADFLSGIDEKIESLGVEIEGSEEFKRGLLQEMFV